MKQKYNIGLDIGTTSVGWAVVESGTQKVIRKAKGKDRKALWGVRLFEEASTAEGRRGFRSTRRRYDRRRGRINLLQKEFEPEINKVDINFFTKLKESKYQENDTANKTITLTSEERRQIREYYKKYPTIYHLRNELINNKEQADIRLVYLALHHMIKYRGNFLYSADNFNVNDLNFEQKLKDVLNLFDELCSNLELSDELDELFDYEQLGTILVGNSKNDAKAYLEESLKSVCNNKNFVKEFTKMIIGNKFSLIKLFAVEDVEKDLSISFDGSDFDDKYSEIENLIGDLTKALSLAKELYDCIFLKKLFKGSKNTSISSLMIEKYEHHKKELRFLKDLFDSDRKVYNKFFRNPKDLKKDDDKCLYEKYIHNKLSFEELKKELDKYILDFLDKSDVSITDRWNELKLNYENDSFLPRVTDPENGKYSYQLNKEELIKIIENQGQYYPFLLEKVNEKYKIVKILDFKIPYYVGPLNNKSKFAWMERIEGKEHIKINPYNFDEVVDKEKTAEKFITRMISHCTYILEEPALPNNSILYCKYKVMNELEQIRINGVKIKNDIQHKIIEELFMKSGSVTDSKFKKYIKTLSDYSMYGDDINVTGYSADGKFANNMQSYVDFFGENGIFSGTSYNQNDADQIIRWITIFEDKDILEKKVRDSYVELSDSQLKIILSKKYSGWGSLSEKLLCTKYYKDKVDGTLKSIMDLMYETEDNFMQILNNDEYKFQEMIRSENKLEGDIKLSYKVVEDLATSSATKKGIYQALKVVDEIVDYMGYEPENIMIEMARGEDKVKQRKDDKKKYLQALYKNIENTIDNYKQLSNELNSYEKIDTERLYLYFIQEGKCLYTGKPLNINDLSNSCEIDHIIPRSLIKDNSIDNKALVLRECNQVKKDSLVLPSEYRSSINKNWWNHLKDNGLISNKKFYRLTRKEYSDEDIEGFINRQLVETRQITKHVANILNSFYKDTKIIYLKASLSHDYRDRYELFKFRDINDYHHAHDAYLAAVLGEYKEKYMTRKVNYEMIKELNAKIRELGNYKKLKYGFVINSLDSEVNGIVYELSKNMVDKDTGELLFDSERFNRIVEDTLYRNDILISRKTEIRSGRFFKEEIHSAGVGNVKLKNNMPTEIYGGYLNVETSYLVLVEYNKKRKAIGIPMEIAKKSKRNLNIKLDYIKEHLKLEDVSEFKILKDFIPFESLVSYKDQDVYITGYSISHKNCELSNANQLKIKKDVMKQIKNTLNKIYMKKCDDVTEEDISNAVFFINYLYEYKKNYPLFEKSISKIQDAINLDVCSFEELKVLIQQLLIIYHCNSKNGNLSDFGLSNRIGRLSGNNVDSGCLSFTSVTGLKESKYEF